jgi:hypothetical protein
MVYSKAIDYFRSIVSEGLMNGVFPQVMGINVICLNFFVKCTGEDEIADMLHERKKLSSMFSPIVTESWMGANA